MEVEISVLRQDISCLTHDKKKLTKSVQNRNNIELHKNKRLVHEGVQEHHDDEDHYHLIYLLRHALKSSLRVEMVLVKPLFLSHILLDYLCFSD